MADLIKKIKIKKQDGTFTDYIPIGAEAKDVNVDGESVQYKLNKKPYYYDSVADMKADTKLKAGDMAITLGYHEVNDGGGAEYQIVENSNLANHQEQLENSLYASLIIKKNEINIRQLGATPWLLTAERVDTKPYIDIYLRLCNNNEHGRPYTLYIPTGRWLFSETLLSRWHGLIIKGEKIFPRLRADSSYFSQGTVIMPLQDEQDYIWKLGGWEDVDDNTERGVVNSMTTQVHMEGLIFTTYTGNPVQTWTVNKACFYIDKCMYCTFEDIYCFNFRGNGVAIRSSWELNFQTLMFRGQYGFEYSSLLFPKLAPISGVSPNISALYIDSLMFEGQQGHCIWSEPGSGFSHNHFGHINIEYGWASQDYMAIDEDVSSYIPIDMIGGFYRFTHIDGINLVYNNGGEKVTIQDENKTYYTRSLIGDDLFEIATNEYDRRCFLSVGDIVFRGQNHTHFSLYYAKKSYLYSGFSCDSIMIQDSPGQGFKIVDCNRCNPPSIGTIFETSTLIPVKKEDDAYQFCSDYNVWTDETSPSSLHLVARKKEEGNSSTVALFDYNLDRPCENVNHLHTLHFIVKKMTSVTTKIVVYTKYQGQSINDNFNVPGEEGTWQHVTMTLAIDDYSAIAIRAQADAEVAKFWVDYNPISS